jgi:hypothetical protein
MLCPYNKSSRPQKKQFESPNNAVEWATLLIRVREVHGSKLGTEIGYHGSHFRGFSSVPPRKLWDNASD